MIAGTTRKLMYEILFIWLYGGFGGHHMDFWRRGAHIGPKTVE